MVSAAEPVTRIERIESKLDQLLALQSDLLAARERIAVLEKLLVHVDNKDA